MVVSNEQMSLKYYKSLNFLLEGQSKEEHTDFNISDYINDVPLLVDDVTDDEDELESKKSSSLSTTSLDIKRVGIELGSVNVENAVANLNLFTGNGIAGVRKIRPKRPRTKAPVSLTPKDFKQERNQLMMVIIKYVSIKITNLFPPTSAESKISLEKFLVIMINRLKLSMTNFLKSVIYLFRYMDIIYLLRYLNQCNNYANFNEMEFPLKKLIVACFKLTLLRERIHKNWFKMTGLSDNEINVIIQTILKRLNSKVVIKPKEIEKFKLEILKYVKMVSKEV